MSSHREGAQVANLLFTAFQGMTPQQQTVMGQLLNLPGADTRGFTSTQALAEEVEEARQHFLAKLASA